MSIMRTPYSLPARFIHQRNCRTVASSVMTKTDRVSERAGRVMALLVPLALIGVREVVGFILGLLLFGAHTIELRLVQHNLDGIVPTQILMLIEDFANLLLQVFGDLDFVSFLAELFLQLLKLFAQLLTVMECSVGIREQPVIRDYLFEAVVLQLALDHFDQGVAGHGVKLDPLVDQNCDLFARRAILSELAAQDVLARLARRGR